MTEPVGRAVTERARKRKKPGETTASPPEAGEQERDPTRSPRPADNSETDPHVDPKRHGMPASPISDEDVPAPWRPDVPTATKPKDNDEG